MVKIIKCKCCRKKIEDMFNRKYCSSCSVYTKELREKIYYYKRRFEFLNKKLYGTKNGSERIRDTSFKPKTK